MTQTLEELKELGRKALAPTDEAEKKTRSTVTGAVFNVFNAKRISELDPARYGLIRAMFQQWIEEDHPLMSVSADEPLKIKVGKYYRSASGVKVGPMRERDGHFYHGPTFYGPGILQAGTRSSNQIYREDGSVYRSGPGEEDHHLIAEWVDEPTTEGTHIHAALLAQEDLGIVGDPYLGFEDFPILDIPTLARRGQSRPGVDLTAITTPFGPLMETGTLKELQVQPGDVVESYTTAAGTPCPEGIEYKILCHDGRQYRGIKETYPAGHPGTALANYHVWRLVSRATPPQPAVDLTAITTPFGPLMETGTLKPCPFCGSNPEMVRPMGDKIYNGKPPFFGPQKYRLSCPTEGCCTMTEAYNEASQAIAAWNRRTGGSAMKTGTLKELQVQPGDVVECLYWKQGTRYPYAGSHTIGYGAHGLAAYQTGQDTIHFTLNAGAIFRLVSRAADEQPTEPEAPNPGWGWTQHSCQEAPDDSNAAYANIVRSLADAVRASLEDADHEAALKYADLMRQAERKVTEVRVRAGVSPDEIADLMRYPYYLGRWGIDGERKS